MKTRAAVVYEHDAPVVVETLTLDDPKDNEVLLRMGASGVCHSDLSVVNGTIYYPPPVALGHEGAGIVERVGANVTYVKPGDHVILSFVTYCENCVMCEMGRVCLCQGFDVRKGYLLDDTCRLHNAKGQDIPQMSRIATMSELAVVPEQALIKIDPGYPLDRAALVGCGVTTGVGAVLRTAKVEAGSTVAVIGTGGVGLNAVQGARVAGAERIIAVDLVEKKLDFARQFGATDTVNGSETDAVEAVKELTGGLGVDYAFEAIGSSVTIRQAFDMVRSAGTAVAIGLARQDDTVPIPPQELIWAEKRLLGSYYGTSRPRVDMPEYLRLYDEGKLMLDELITQTYQLEQINDAFADMEAGENARGILALDL
ncbi:MAG: Zn-dependent alcohol dehydrogenase [Caldilineaceae bacterium SB0661_bin_32]|uniref:Zn-dependent alcohol dehydrogenase n=1 Tax=Caldilineaceae bacterium SB0661_bin_32 TaxID=2605255 RepID=A0A6B1D3L2_9CHLR|nr:Zn-dependent alcohol dehydrogenase [Caldilineaceae bacterium SB0661_bin_32]